MRTEMFSIINSSKISQKVGDWLAVVVFGVAQVYPLCFRRRIVELLMCALWLENAISRFLFFIGPKRINLLVAMEVSDCGLLSEAVLKGSPMYLVLSNNSCCRKKKTASIIEKP